MNTYFLSFLSDRDVTIDNEPGLVTQCVDFLLSLMGDFVKMIRSIYIYDGEFSQVSLFDFLIVLIVMAIVITYLVNVARSPSVETTTKQRERVAESKRRGD